MNNLIKLTQPDGSGLFVNMEQVREFYISESKDTTVLIFDNEHNSFVKETPKEIFQLLQLII